MPASITTRIELKTNQRAHLILNSGSGSHSSSFRDKAVTKSIGKSNSMYHGAPQRSSICLTPPSTENPNMLVAKSVANVTLRPRNARHSQAKPGKMFT
jgi:hypothetical protein